MNMQEKLDEHAKYSLFNYKKEFMQEKIKGFSYCISFIENDLSKLSKGLTSDMREEIEMYRSLIRIYERRMRLNK